MQAKVRFTDVISDFTYHPSVGGYTCDEDTRKDKMLFAPYELVEIR